MATIAQKKEYKKRICEFIDKLQDKDEIEMPMYSPIRETTKKGDRYKNYEATGQQCLIVNVNRCDVTVGGV